MTKAQWNSLTKERQRQINAMHEVTKEIVDENRKASAPTNRTPKPMRPLMLIRYHRSPKV